MNPIFIAPPFGNYIQGIRGTTPVCGSYTAQPRTGLLGAALRTIRPIRGGWVNSIGLRNPGIRNVEFNPHCVYSLAPLDEDDYDDFYDVVPHNTMIEFNLGCPNVDHQPKIGPWEWFTRYYPLVIMKLPPTPVGRTLLGQACLQGVRYFHLCNTIPTERGGESGDRLRELSLRAIEWVRSHRAFDNIKLIGGGGIYDPMHVKEYALAGADAVSIGTAFFRPWTIPAILKEARRLRPL